MSEVPDIPAKVFETLDQQGGRLVLAKMTDNGTWITALEFGQEAEGSDMYAGAAYGTANTAQEALDALVGDL